MNEQKAGSSNSIEWTRIRRPDGTRMRGYTWNPVAGCQHGCQWTMPDGKTAICYADSAASGIAKAAYPEGFAHHYWHPERLEEPLKVKEPSGIFLDSMSDLMGAWVPTEQIQQVLDICEKAHWHTFQLLTKNSPRLKQFDFPPNAWVGCSSPPDFMFGKPLDRKQQMAMLERSLTCLAQENVPVRWMSFEPLSWDCSSIVRRFAGVLKWAVIGAASNGRNYYPPKKSDLLALLWVLDAQKCRVFFKGNLRSLPWAANHWREEFPDWRQ